MRLFAKDQHQVSNRTITSCRNDKAINTNFEQAITINTRVMSFGVMMRQDFCVKVKVSNSLAHLPFRKPAIKATITEYFYNHFSTIKKASDSRGEMRGTVVCNVIQLPLKKHYQKSYILST